MCEPRKDTCNWAATVHCDGKARKGPRLRRTCAVIIFISIGGCLASGYGYLELDIASKDTPDDGLANRIREYYMPMAYGGILAFVMALLFTVFLWADKELGIAKSLRDREQKKPKK